MPLESGLLDPALWHRGRSRRRSFPTLDSERVEEVLSVLPDEFAPYALYAHQLVGEGREHRSVLNRVRADTVSDLHGKGVWQFFVVSSRLSRALLDHPESWTDALFAVNGAIGIQVSPPPTRAGLDFTLTLTAVSGDRFVEHSDYERVFRAVVARARRLSS